MPETVTTTYRLRIRNPNGRVHDWTLGAGVTIVGRDPQATLSIQHPSVSRRHCEIRRLDTGSLIIRDLGSTNGTALNGILVSESVIAPGDILQLGDIRIEVLSEEPAIPKPPSPAPVQRTGGLDIVESLSPEAPLQLPAVGEGEEEDGGVTSFSVSPPQMANRFRRLQTAFGTLISLGSFSGRMLELRSDEDFYEFVLESLRTVFPKADNIAILARPRFDPEGEAPAAAPDSADMLEVAAQEFYVAPEGSTASPSRAVLQSVMENKRGIAAVDAQNDPRFQKSESVRQRHLRSVLCMPALRNAQVYGALYIESVTNPFCFDTQDLQVLGFMASQMAAAIEFRRSHESLARAYDRSHSEAQSAIRDKVALTLAVRQSEVKFRALFEQSALGILLVDARSGIIQEANEALALLLDIPRRELAGRPFRDLFPSPESLAIGDWLRLVRQRGEANAETRLVRSDGAHVAVFQSSRSLNVGNEEMVLVNYLNITERKRAEQESKTQLRRLTTLQEISLAFMSTLDLARLYRQVYEKVRSVIPTDAFMISIVQRGGETMRPAFIVDLVDGQPQTFIDRQTVPVNTPLVKRLIEKREPVLILHRSENEELDTPLVAFGTPRRSASLLFVPMIAGDTVIGTMSAQSYTPDAYDSSHPDLLLSIATLAALAIQNARFYDSIRRQREDLLHLSNQLLEAQEQERGRIARELHDGVGQILTGLKLNLKSALQSIPDMDKVLAGKFADALDLTTRAMEDLRAISLDLRPSMLDDLGLIPTLEWYCSEIQRRHGLEVEFSSDMNGPKIPDRIEASLYRIVQEGLGNIVKHAKAKRASVDIVQHHQNISLKITDNGQGFDPGELPAWQSQRHCSGILNMKERAAMLGGSFHLASAPGEGAVLTFEIPLSGRSHTWPKTQPFGF